MKKYLISSLIICVSIVLFSCSIPRATGPYKVVEKKQNSTEVNNPSPGYQKPAAATDNNKNYKEETFSLASISDADKLRTYSVVVGSFSNEQNAINLKNSLKPQYNPIIVINSKGMFRVLLVSYDTYEEAKAKIANIVSKFSDAWVLVQKR